MYLLRSLCFKVAMSSFVFSALNGKIGYFTRFEQDSKSFVITSDMPFIIVAEESVKWIVYIHMRKKGCSPYVDWKIYLQLIPFFFHQRSIPEPTHLDWTWELNI